MRHIQRIGYTDGHINEFVNLESKRDNGAVRNIRIDGKHCAENDAVRRDGIDWHYNAEADGIWNRCVVEKYDTAEASYLSQYLSVCCAENGNGRIVIVEPKMEPVSLEITVKRHGNVHGLTRARRDCGRAEVAVVR